MELKIYGSGYKLCNSYNDKCIEFVIYDPKYNVKNVSEKIKHLVWEDVEAKGSVTFDLTRKIKLSLKKSIQKKENFFINGNLKNFPSYNKIGYNKKYGFSHYDIRYKQIIVIFIFVENVYDENLNILGYNIQNVKKSRRPHKEKRENRYEMNIYKLRDELSNTPLFHLNKFKNTLDKLSKEVYNLERIQRKN